MPVQLERQRVHIVLRGLLNPAIFHPSWFAAHGLIRDQEAEAAKVDIVHPEAAVFEAEWLQVSAFRDRFQAGTTQEAYYEPLRDLVIGVFGLLSHTPLTAMGLNRDFHYRLESEKAWHGLGHRLVPKENWEEVLKGPGMMSLSVQGRRPDDLKGYIQVRVEPSTEVQYGVYVQVNDHYTLGPGDGSVSGADTATQILATQWADSMSRSLTIAKGIVDVEKPR